MAFVVKTGKSVEEAINSALKELNASREEVEVEVIKEAKSGFFGFFGSDAEVRVTVKEVAEKITETVEEVKKEEKSVEEALDEAKIALKGVATAAAATLDKKASELKKDAKIATDDLAKKANEAKDKAIDNAINTLEGIKSEKKEAREKRYAVNDESIAAARDFLQKIFKAMHISVQMEKFVSKNDGTVTFKLHGDDMGILIGKHGQTLDSLQYLTNLVANKNSNERVRVVIDVEDYRDRRVETLTRLARRLADKVKKSGERVALEPMNPHERKIIHMALQGDRRVTTLSEGDDPNRHVVIELKK
ncbi:MAG: RNA-binding cell elongation regulator Jag/EloR [Phascolarctobacterium sp.]|nr:RNA-binding cell elongation regulator Jag/EloR [Phascolarctobacterium sp.]